MVAATVPAVAHVNSLTEYESVEAEDGSIKLKKTGVDEQRLTGFSIHLLIGAAFIFSRPLLRTIPSAVFTGLFLYLGMSSIGGTSFAQRVKMLISDRRDIAASVTKNISLSKVKSFTILQLFFLGSIMWLKGTKLGVFFPV